MSDESALSLSPFGARYALTVRAVVDRATVEEAAGQARRANEDAMAADVLERLRPDQTAQHIMALERQQALLEGELAVARARVQQCDADRQLLIAEAKPGLGAALANNGEERARRVAVVAEHERELEALAPVIAAAKARWATITQQAARDAHTARCAGINADLEEALQEFLKENAKRLQKLLTMAQLSRTAGGCRAKVPDLRQLAQETTEPAAETPAAETPAAEEARE